MIDGGQSISEQDLRIIQTIREAGRALVIAFNKWDLVDDERRHYLEREIERELVQVQWAPRINITARTGWHVDRLVPALDKALEGWETRISTGSLNAFLGRLVSEHPHPVRGGKQPKILFDSVTFILAALPEPPPEQDAEIGGPRRIAIVGKPNVGKSSLLNSSPARTASSSTTSPAPRSTRSTS